MGAFGHNQQNFRHHTTELRAKILGIFITIIFYKIVLISKSIIHLHPFSRLYFATGIPKLQYFGGTHAQSVKNFNFGVDFQVINSLGTYQRQRVTMGSASTYLKYVTNNKKYGILASFQFNQFTAQENGGIADDSLFTYNEEPFRPGMPININTKAENKYLDNEFALTHYFDFLAKNDSTISKFTFGENYP
ncbi:MAG: putative porin [Bacteroidales bacterium]